MRKQDWNEKYLRREKFFSFILISLLIFITGSSLLFAQFSSPKKERGSISFSLENDVWLNQDEGYTNGVQLMWVSPALLDNNQGSFLLFLKRLNLKFLGQVEISGHGKTKMGKEERRASLSLVQTIFTPDCLTEKELIPDDRPYAGLLYANLGLIKQGRGRQDSIGFLAGVVGPWSLAGTIQRWLHETYGWTYPEGWENQLKNEPVLGIWLNRFWTLIGPNISNQRFQPALKAGIGGQLGNLMTALQAVIDLKLGVNIEPQTDAFSSSPFFGHLIIGRVTRTSVYAFTRLEGRLVARNLLLEGNTFVPSHGVEIHHFYGQWTTGLAYQSNQAAVLLYLVMRTKEFIGQKYREPYVGLTFTFNL